MAGTLGSAINSSSCSPVTASVSNLAITLTAKTGGAATNYSLSGSSSTSLPGTFSSPSFTVSVSGSALAGGADGRVVFDTGSVSIAVNGVSTSIAYGQNDTNLTVASSLANAINNNGTSPVTATVAGGLILLTAKSQGAATNYSLSTTSSTSQPASFSGASFSVSVSGSALAGGSASATSMFASTAYAPFGEPYAQAGSPDSSFGGINQDTVTGLYDADARQYNSIHGRWPSPDPADVNSVNPANPQSWNRYVYALNNPLALVDPSGLECITLDDGTIADDGNPPPCDDPSVWEPVVVEVTDTAPPPIETTDSTLPDTLQDPNDVSLDPLGPFDPCRESGNRGFHEGARDFGAPKGLSSDVIAADDGKIIDERSGRPHVPGPYDLKNHPRPAPNEQPNYVKLRTNDGYTITYAHTTPTVPINTPVNQGDVVGHADNSGRTTGPMDIRRCRIRKANRWIRRTILEIAHSTKTELESMMYSGFLRYSSLRAWTFAACLVSAPLCLPTTAILAGVLETPSFAQDAKGANGNLEDLRSAGLKLVTLLKEGRPADLPALCWRKGVTIDLDGTTVSPTKLGEMITRKNWFYCAYFENICAKTNKEGTNRPAYRDLLREAASVRVAPEIRMPTGNRKFGIVTLEIEGGSAKELLEKHEYKFIYILDGASWKLSCLECDPEYYF